MSRAREPWFAAPRLLVPSVYVRRSPTLRRLFYARRINDRIYIDWRLPGDSRNEVQPLSYSTRMRMAAEAEAEAKINQRGSGA